ncbi:MAG: PAS domain S-box protein [Elusimicrobia bacterium]|nr:PAS domain S-box protein [Elusimicrobiota bacterium]
MAELHPDQGLLRFKRRLWVLLALFSAGIVAGGVIYHADFRGAVVREKSDLLTSIGRTKTADLVYWREQREQSLASLVDSPILGGYLEQVAAGQAGSEQLRLLSGRLAAFAKNNHYASAYLSSSDGKVLLGAGLARKRVCPGAMALLKRMGDSKAPFIGDLELDEGGQPAIHGAILAAWAGGRKTYLVITIDPYVYLYPFMRTWPTGSASAETLLVRRDGDYVLFLNDLKHIRHTGLRFRIPMSNETLPAAAGLRGFSGVMRGVDYRGVKVLAYVSRVPGTDWVIISKEDEAEIFSGLHRTTSILFALVLALLAGGGVLVYSLVMRREAEYVSGLGEAEARFTRLYSQMLDSYAYVDMAGHIMECNAAFEQLTGYTLDELRRLSYSDITPEKWRQAEKRIVEEIISKGAYGLYEKEYRRKDGTIVPVELRTVLDRDGAGRPVGIWTIIRDLSERKKAELALAGSEEQFRLMFEEHNAVMLLIDPASGEVVKANKAAEEFYGYPKASMVGMNIAKMNGLERAEIAEMHGKILRGEQNLFTLLHRLADGSGRTVEVRSSSIPSGGRELNFEIIHDITERERAVERLRASETALKEAQRLAKIGNWELDIASNGLRWSEEIFSIFEIDPSRFGASYAAFLDAIHPDDREEVNKAYTDSLKNRTRYNITHRLLMKDGRVKHVNEVCETFYDPAGKPLRSVGTVQDITERKTAEEKIRESELALREAQRVARIGSWDWDAGTDTITWSPEYYRIFGFDPTMKPPGYKEHLKVYTAESAARLDAAVKRNMKTGEPYVLDLELVNPKNGTRWITARSETKRDDKGRITGLRGTAQDITERKLAERTLQETLFFLNESQNAACIGSYTTDFGKGRWESSEGLDKIFGIGPDYDRSVEGWMSMVHPDDRARMEKYLWEEVIGKRKDFDREYRITRVSDGKTRWVHGRGAMTFGPGGSPLRMIGTIQDITERRAAETERAVLLERLRLAAGAAGLGIWDWDIPADRLTWDDRMFELYGVRREDFKGAYEAWFGGVHPEDRERCDEALRLALSGDRKYDIEFRVRWPDGAVREIKADGEVYRDGSGKPVRMVGVNRDITESRTAEKLVLAEKLKAESYLEIIGVIMLALEPDQTISLVNRKCCEMLGYSREELIGRNWFEVAIPEEQRAAVKEVFHKIISGDLAPVEHYENDVVTKSGERRTIAWTNAMRTDPDGRVTGLLTSGEDVTERRRMEGELRELARQRQLALDAARLGWWSYDPVSSVSTYDDGYKRIFEVNGHSKPNDEILKLLHPEDLPGVWTKVQAALDPADPRPYRAEYRVVMPGGAVKWVEAYGAAVFKGEGPERRAVDFVGTVADITERKLAESRLQEFAASLADKNKELEDFLYVASHDLRGPLVNVQGFSQNIKKYCVEMAAELKPQEGSKAWDIMKRKVPEALDFLLGGASRMDALISALLKVSRLGRAELRPERVDMGKLISEIDAALSYQLAGTGGRIKAGPLPPCQGDRLQLSQVFYNLADNALKYREPGRPPVIEIAGEPEDGGFVRYTVSDNGRGLTQEEADGKIWSLFYRSESSGDVEGEGIGLTSAKRIVERHGGSIAASRNAEGGTTFTIRLKAERG